MKHTIHVEDGTIIDIEAWMGEFDAAITLRLPKGANCIDTSQKMVALLNQGDIQSLIFALQRTNEECNRIYWELEEINNKT